MTFNYILQTEKRLESPALYEPKPSRTGQSLYNTLFKLELSMSLRSGLWARARQKVSKTLNFVTVSSEKITNYLYLIFKIFVIIRKSAPTSAAEHDERHK